MQRGRSGRWTVLACLAWVIAPAWAGSGAGAARGGDVGFETLRVGFASSSHGNLFKYGTWTPVRVQVRGGSAPFDGTLELEVPDDDGTPTLLRRKVTIPSNASPWFTVYTRPGSHNPEFRLRLLDSADRVVARLGTENLGMPLDPMLPDETLLLSLGQAEGLDRIGNLPGFSPERNGGNPVVTVARLDPKAGQVPAQWLGFDAAEAVVVDTNDRDVMAALPAQGPALVEWVARGGHLVVAVNSNWQAVRDSVLEPLLPAVIAGRERVVSLGGLDTFAGRNDNPITPAGTEATLVAKLEQVEARGGKTLIAEGPLPLVVRGIHGFGRVTLVGLDVDQKPFSTWPNRPLFWVHAVDLHRGGSENPGVPRQGSGRVFQSGVSDLSTMLRQSLEQFPGVKLVPFGWVAFFIFVYVLLIGPGDYLFLRKVVKRMELTWVTFPLIVIGVSVAAYLGAYAMKGTELRVNKVDVLDVDQSAGGTSPSVPSRGSTFLNIFSPQNRDYDVAVVPHPIDRKAEAPVTGAPAFRADSSPRPGVATEVDLSWLGVPEAGFGGMAGGQVGLGGGGYRYQPAGRAEQLTGVRVAIWSTKSLGARWFGPAPRVAGSDLVRVGSDRLSGSVTNHLDVPLVDALVVFNRHVYELGTLAPGATLRVELGRDRQFPGLLRDHSRTYLPGQDWAANGGKINRADLALALMFHASQGSPTGERPLPSDPLHFLDLTGLLALDRPMLVGRVDRPAAQVVLGNAPATPQVEQTTMLRVLLPLGKPPEGS